VFSVQRVARRTDAVEATSDAMEMLGAVEAAATVGCWLPAAVESVVADLPGCCDSGTAVRKDMRLPPPKNLAMKTVAWPCVSAPSIHYNGVGRICTGEGGWRGRERMAHAEQDEQSVRSALSVWMVRCVRMKTGRPNALNKALP
jgi:hypothetical protein